MTAPELKAQELLDTLDIDSLPVRPREICSRLNVSYHEHPFDGFDGLLIVGGNSSVIGVNSNIETAGRKAYTAAHELGHLCLHAKVAERFECNSDDLTSISKLDMEIEANAFAAELMMPKPLVAPIIRSDVLTWDAVKSLALHCDTSLTAAAIRFVNLTEVPCAVVIAQNGVIKFYRASNEFQYRVDMDSRLLAKNSAAHTSHSGKIPQNDFAPIHPSNWLTGKFTTDSELLEWSLPKNRYGQVLTLLLDEGDVCFAKDGRNLGSRTSFSDEDEEDGLGVDKFMAEVNPFKRGKRRR